MDLSTILDEGYFKREGWCDFKDDLIQLLQSLAGYVQYLSAKNKVMKVHHKLLAPVRELSTNLHIPGSTDDYSLLDSVFSDIEKACQDVPHYDSINLSSFLSSETLKRPKEIEKITQDGLCCGPSVLLSYCPGNNVGNMYFLWRVPEDVEPVSRIAKPRLKM